MLDGAVPAWIMGKVKAAEAILASWEDPRRERSLAPAELMPN
jgi:hypothetical protein